MTFKITSDWLKKTLHDESLIFKTHRANKRNEIGLYKQTDSKVLCIHHLFVKTGTPFFIKRVYGT